AECVTFPEFNDEADFKKWLNSVKGKIVLVSEPELTGRPDYNWDEFGTKESIEKMKAEREAAGKKWNENIEKTGMPTRSRDGAKTIYDAIEEAGAVAVISSRWSQGFGVNKIFSTITKKIPSFDVGMEDYGLIYRLTANGDKPKLRLKADAKFNGAVPNNNTVAEIKGGKMAKQYVMLSAHFDSWDGGSGATDNGTGTLVMMEAMRILKKVYPKPNRTLMVGHWSSEEQGLNGSGAFVEDHPEIVKNLQALFNQDNGTGRVINMSGSGFVHSSEFLGRWLQQVPSEVTDGIKTNFPGTPSGGGTDHASFVIAGAPGFGLSSLNWSYWNYTWHTNRDTYDKLVWDDLVNNVILVASLAYLASEDPQFFPRDRREVMPVSRRTGEPMTWPEKRNPERKGRLDD
ncbi:MAG: M20/M25/M40 family metallo-hydrolase, partial [Calditrichaeota bacterium]|nr:M20/M25/M40 family metallo-hydrolase [Calditrichota bacterium]